MTSFLHEQRLAAVGDAVAASGASRVLDLGCGDGDMLVRLAQAPQITEVVGIDIDAAALDRLRGRLAALKTPPTARVELICGSMSVPDPRLSGFDCAILVETIEHLNPDHLSALERAVFGSMRPGTVIVTTPNAEFNALLGVPTNRFRHPGHRFEWTRAKFQAWAMGLARRCRYDARFGDIAGQHRDFGGASQMAVFRDLDRVRVRDDVVVADR